MRGKVGKPEVGKPALAHAKKFAGTTQTQILFGNDKAIIALAQHLEALPGNLTQRLVIDEQTG